MNRIFVENTWYAAAWDYEVAEADNKLARTICEVPLVIYQGESGEYIALDNRCCHRAAALSSGRIEGDCIRCMYHGILYDKDGKGLEVPGQDRVPASIQVRNYPIAHKGGMLWIWMGDPALAYEADIYDFPPLSQPETWRGFDKPSYLHYKANWLLIVDNLADFSHVAFVHTNTLGGSEDYAYVTNPDVEKLDDGIGIKRWHRNSDAPPYHSKVIPESERSMKLDRLNDLTMHIPGIFLMNTTFGPTGWPEDEELRKQCREYRNCQFMTPETRNTTHFFWNYLHNTDLDKPDVSASLKDSLLEGFIEDKVIIEEQQILLEESPEFVPKFIGADEAFAHFRMVWNRLLKAENEANPIIIKENKKRIL